MLINKGNRNTVFQPSLGLLQCVLDVLDFIWCPEFCRPLTCNKHFSCLRRSVWHAWWTYEAVDVLLLLLLLLLLFEVSLSSLRSCEARHYGDHSLRERGNQANRQQVSPDKQPTSPSLEIRTTWRQADTRNHFMGDIQESAEMHHFIYIYIFFFYPFSFFIKTC